MSLLGMLLGFGAAAIGAGVSAFGQSQANKANAIEAEKQRAFNSAEAQKERDFQLQMANTAHQREVKDLKAAGLNPWLSVNGAGATSGVQSSAASSTSTVGHQENNLSDLARLTSSIKDLAFISLLAKGKK